MAKELYLYSPIYDFTAEALIASIEDNKDEDITIRANTPGGSVFSGWGIIAKMKEHAGKISIKVDGSVASMGAYMIAFADHVEALDVSKIMIHRADMYVENEEDQKFLDEVNADLKKKLKAKIDNKKLKELKGIGIDELFSSEERIDLWLTAREAKQVGLINKVNKLSASEMKAYNDKYFAIAAEEKPVKKEKKQEPEQKQKPKIMNKETLKAEHPDLYKEIRNEGVNAERDRTEAWMTFADVDVDAVKEGISKGESISAKMQAELSRKAFSAAALKKVEEDNPDAIETDEPEAKGKGDKEKEVEAFEKEVKMNLGLIKNPS